MRTANDKGKVGIWFAGTFGPLKGPLERLLTGHPRLLRCPHGVSKTCRAKTISYYFTLSLSSHRAAGIGPDNRASSTVAEEERRKEEGEKRERKGKDEKRKVKKDGNGRLRPVLYVRSNVLLEN